MASLDYFENARTGGISMHELGSSTIGGDVKPEDNHVIFTYKP